VTDSLQNVNARGTLDATKPPDSPYWEQRKRADEKKAARQREAASRGATGSGADEQLPALNFTMDWDQEAETLIRKMPEGIIDMAVTTVEDYAKEQDCTLVTRQVLEDQMKSIGMDPAQFLGG